MTEEEIIKIITTGLANLKYGNEPIEVIRELRINMLHIDLIVKAGKRKIAAIEITGQGNLKHIQDVFNFDLFFLLKVRYFIYTDGDSFLIFDRLAQEKKHRVVDFNTFRETLIKQITKAELSKVKAQASKIFEEETLLNSNKFPTLKKLMENFKSKINNELLLSSDYMLFFEGAKEDENSFEHLFFRHLLDNGVPDTIYRYCNFSRAFQILEDNKLAMLGIPGMNDTTEPNYVDNYINESDEQVWELPPQSRAAINRRFIMSCTELPDNLMQWRLYGEDAMGACIKFETKVSLKTNQRFYLGQVKYANSNGEHPELLFIKGIINRIRTELLLDFKFVLLYVWRHFFKPHGYEYEKEVRLLYIHRHVDREKKWIIAEPYSIVNPMVIFDLSQEVFPLAIKEIMVGPKRPEKKLNKSQLEQMALEKRRPIIISESKQNVYR